MAAAHGREPEELGREAELQGDREALRRIREGRSEAYAEIVRRHGPPLHRLLCRMLRDEHAAEDLLQEVFIKAWRALPRFDASRALHPWLRKIAVHCALDELNARKRRGEIEDPEELLLRLRSTADSEAELRERELREAIEWAISTLPPEWAAVFRLRVQEELSYAEIAESLDVPVGSVMSRLSRARTRLAELLSGRLGDGKEVGDERRTR